MGLRNVLAACAVDRDKLSDAARLTLVVMSAASYDEKHDGQEPRIYWGGWKFAMIRQGFWPDEKAKRRFIRHIAELKMRGIVEVAAPASHGRNAQYRLRLPVENSADSVDDEHSDGG
jgi:hypothetical protein